LRSFSPSVNNNNNNSKFPYLKVFNLTANQPIRKESPSAQTSAKFRQRSSSPSQNANYNSLFGNFMGPKPKWKF